MQRLWPDAFQVLLPRADEKDTIQNWEGGPDGLARQLALLKARAALAQNELPASYCLVAADTLVVDRDVVLGKPADADEAARHLKALSGRTHFVYTGLALALGQNEETEILSAVEKTSVSFNELDQAMLDWYIGTGEPFGKAGSYAIQGYGAALVKSITGCYYNVMGLPLTRLLALLQQALAKLSSFNGLDQLLPWS